MCVFPGSPDACHSMGKAYSDSWISQGLNCVGWLFFGPVNRTGDRMTLRLLASTDYQIVFPKGEDDVHLTVVRDSFTVGDLGP